MHWVNRGQEPKRLAAIHASYTSRWVDFYRHQIGTKPPSDSYWRDFHDELGQVFSWLCGYCEEPRKGEIDHFRPKSQFPESVYIWSNWVFACHECNQAKGEKWPTPRYIDPCTSFVIDHPENFFEFDSTTGEILPKQSLSLDKFERARRMIDDLRLNDRHHLKQRREWIILVSAAILRTPSAQNNELRNLRYHLASRSTQLSSISRAWLAEHPSL